MRFIPQWFVRQKTLDKQLGAQAEKHCAVIRGLRTELSTERRQLSEILQRFHDLHIGHDPVRHEFRVLLSVSSLVLGGARGGDNEAWRYIARALGSQLERELAGVNIATIRPLDAGADLSHAEYRMAPQEWRVSL